MTAYLRIPDVEQVTGLSRATVYRLIKSGKLEAHKVGRALLVEPDAVHRLVKGCA